MTEGAAGAADRRRPDAPASNLSARTVRVLGVLASHHDGIGLSDLARACDIPKATCLRILRALESELLVSCDGISRRYHAAIGVIALFGGLLQGESIHLMVFREIENLVQDTQETGGLDVIAEQGIVVVMQVQGPQLISQAAPVPRTLPETVTSTGKVLNAWRDPDEVRARMAGRYDEREIEAFFEQLATTREQGYGSAVDELADGAAAVAYPVRFSGEVRAAVWVGGPSFRIVGDRVPDLAERLAITAQRIEQVAAARGGWLFPSVDDRVTPTSPATAQPFRTAR